jgi:hypothetical protein
MKKIKVGNKVNACTPRGNTYYNGKVVAIHPGPRGDWIEVQRKDKTTFRTRAACIYFGHA